MKAGVKGRERRPRAPRGLGDEAVLAIFLILVIVIVFFLGSSGIQVKQASGSSGIQVRNDQKILLNYIIDGNSISNEKLLELMNADYTELKKRLGISSDFAIHFEDENGNLLQIGGKPCMGSGYVYVNGYKCNG